MSTPLRIVVLDRYTIVPLHRNVCRVVHVPHIGVGRCACCVNLDTCETARRVLTDSSAFATLRVGGKARDRVCGTRTHFHRVMEARETVSSMPGTSSGLGSGEGTFVCACCGLEMTFEYKGRCPPYEKNIACVHIHHSHTLLDYALP